jgi:hypothetical protein
VHPGGGIASQFTSASRMIRFPVVVLLLGVGLSACWPFGGGSGKAYMEGRYTMEPLGGAWKSVDSGGADNAWWHKEAGATLYTDSNCEKGYSDSSLARLARAQAAAIESPVLVSENTHQLANRAAYTARYSGEVDGVPVAVTTTVLKKGKCIYDFVLVAPVSRAEALHSDYESHVESFRIKK